MTWAARAQSAGPIVVKIRYGDRSDEKTRWCAAHLPALGARGHPVPTILWHGMISAEWHVTVQNRLPGRPLTALDGPMLEEASRAPGGRVNDCIFCEIVAGRLPSLFRACESSVMRRS
jgi:hypothetical protein